MLTTEGKPMPYPLGYDRYTGQQFGNKDFILNAMNYLVDKNSLISIRSRELTLRLLDRTKISNNRIFWQLFNTLIPVLVILVFGFIKYFTRKRKYSTINNIDEKK